MSSEHDVVHAACGFDVPSAPAGAVSFVSCTVPRVPLRSTRGYSPSPLWDDGLRLRAFTLVEMLVVIAIIALLLAALLPAFSAVKNQAKNSQARAQFGAIDTGLTMFRAEAALGGALPPSSSDERVGNTGHGQLIAKPTGDGSNDTVRIAGAHLLVHALIGADGLGTPGFRDLNQNGKWSDDTHKKLDNSDIKKCGVYAIGDSGETAGKEKFPRYPSGGGGYVDEKMRDSAKSLKELEDKGAVLNVDSAADKIATEERVFLDAWDHPILYYRANSSAVPMVGESGKPGVFWQEDNSIITGSDGLYSHEGMDFGQGKEGDHYHNIAKVVKVEPTETIENIQTEPTYDRSFARFVLDPSVKARRTPVNKDSYLLISAGPDARYGTEDDVTNWTRKSE